VKKRVSILSVIVIGLTYAFMIVSAILNGGTGLSLTTFGLWAILSWITCFSLMKQEASFGAPMVYAVGATTLTTVLLFNGKWNPTSHDAVTAILVGICIVLWKTRGAKWALIISVSAGIIAAFPFIRMTWQDPASSPMLANCFFLIGNILSFGSVKKLAIEDLIFPTANVTLCVCLLIPCVL
jgi:hypothetical protein